MTPEKNNLKPSLVFSLRGPIPIQIDEHSPSNTSANGFWSSGAAVLDLIFPQPETIGEIRFKNWYTARFTLLVRFDDSVQAAPKREHLAWAAAASLSLARLRGVDSTEGIKIGRNLTGSKSFSDWVVSVKNRQLMPDPHSELGSQMITILKSSESLVPLHDITAMRFILRQPSPNWKTFTLEDISVFRHSLPGLSSSLGRSVRSVGLSDDYDNDGKSLTKSRHLEILARQTKEALSGKVLKMDDSQGHEDTGSSSLQLPTSYDISSLQLS